MWSFVTHCCSNIISLPYKTILKTPLYICNISQNQIINKTIVVTLKNLYKHVYTIVPIHATFALKSYWNVLGLILSVIMYNSKTMQKWIGCMQINLNCKPATKGPDLHSWSYKTTAGHTMSWCTRYNEYTSFVKNQWWVNHETTCRMNQGGSMEPEA